MHKCPTCGDIISWRFIVQLLPWRPTKSCPNCKQLLTHSGFLENRPSGDTLDLFLIITSVLGSDYLESLTPLYLAGLILVYRHYQRIQIITADKKLEYVIKKQLELPLPGITSKILAYLGIISSYLVLIACIFILFISEHSDLLLFVPIMFFCILVRLVCSRLLKGESILPTFPLKPPNKNH